MVPFEVRFSPRPSDVSDDDDTLPPLFVVLPVEVRFSPPVSVWCCCVCDPIWCWLISGNGDWPNEKDDGEELSDRLFVDEDSRLH